MHKVITALRELEDEDPLLHVVWVERLAEIHVQLMGAVQLEIIQQTLHDRFGLDVSFGPGSILYRETVTAPIEGAGHFEPLRHYAEAHILLEPGEPGSGVTVASALSENDLDRNWQRLILTHLTEREHLGVLVGAPLTDIKMTLVAGRAHLNIPKAATSAKPPIVRSSGAYGSQSWSQWPARDARSRAVRTPQGRATADCWNRGIGSGSKCQQT